MSNKVPSYQIPTRLITMMNGEPWRFSFDNACIDHMDKHYGGAPSTLELLHSLTAYQQEILNKASVSFEDFKYNLMPPLSEPEVKAVVDSLLDEVKVKQERAKAIRTGNATAAAPIQSPSPSESAPSDATTTVGSSSE